MSANESPFAACEACGATKNHDPARGHAPPGWRMRRIGARVYQLCDACGHDGHFVGGLSPILIARLQARGFTVDEE